jgi:hypothetical protein
LSVVIVRHHRSSSSFVGSTVIMANNITCRRQIVHG